MKFIIPLSVVLWVAEIAYVVPFAVGYAGIFYISPSGICGSRPSAVRPQILLAMVTTAAYAPLAIIGFCCFLMLGYLVRMNWSQAQSAVEGVSNDRSTSRVSESRRRRNRLDRRLAYSKMLLISSIYCAACQMPTYLTVVFFPRFYELYWSVPILRLCQILNPTVNTVRMMLDTLERCTCKITCQSKQFGFSGTDKNDCKTPFPVISSKIHRLPEIAHNVVRGKYSVNDNCSASQLTFYMVNRDFRSAFMSMMRACSHRRRIAPH